ncbi:MAG: hypothetical protein C4530_12620 [Desulfobacteraceae bacterium]|nr:MAG: hypothetical protein C4530_12620 [Desulfobacteraceae bacterium]
MKKGTFCFFLMCLAIFAAFPATGNAVAVKDGVVTLRLAHVNPPGSPTDMAVTKLKELLHQRTDGKVAIKVFPNEQLGAEKAALEGVVLGTIIREGLLTAVDAPDHSGRDRDRHLHTD